MYLIKNNENERINENVENDSLNSKHKKKQLKNYKHVPLLFEQFAGGVSIATGMIDIFP